MHFHIAHLKALKETKKNESREEENWFVWNVNQIKFFMRAARSHSCILLPSCFVDEKDVSFITNKLSTLSAMINIGAFF